MYLQSLELLGFKSFATKTILNFHRGVTAIVGPNGCGKSNVLDAIRWVLGEQSAKALRGGEMADVIFSGTDSKAALGLAEVSMTFAECEQELGVAWNEVRITRRVHRDGHSEYLLNKAPCRLKDIHQLFMDTGIGRSAYSIMEQGKIDLILSSRPEDRRAIFEEAAGITKFKAQKKEALRKLEYTESNLIRVGDIIREVKRQIGSLQRQAGKARRYQALIADLKTFETHHAHQQFRQFSEALNAAGAEIERLTALQGEQQAGIDDRETALTEKRHALEQMEQRLNEARQEVQNHKNQVQTAENRLGFNEERLREFAGLVERYNLDIAAAEEKLQVQAEQMNSTDSELEQIKRTLEFEQSRLEEKHAASSSITGRRGEAESRLQQINNAISRADSRVGSLRSQMASILAQREGQQTRLAILTDEIEQLAAGGERLANQQRDIYERLQKQTEELDAHNQEAEAAREALETAQTQSREIDQQVQVQQRSLSEKQSKLEVLRQLNEEGEGFTEGTQAILRGLDNPDFFKPAVAGAIASHLEVAEVFIPAIESALGQNLQAIVMKDVMVAEAAIKTLSGQKLGRASLAVRELLPSSPQNGHALPKRTLGWAVDKIRAEGEMAILLAHLLSGVVIVDNLEHAIELKPAHPELSFVTMSGELVSCEGIVHGGYTGEVTAGSVLHRRAQIGSLEVEVSAAEEELEGINRRRAELEASVEQAQERLQAAREETQRLTIAVSTLRGEISFLERETRETSTRNQNFAREKENIELRKIEADEKCSALESEAEGAEREITDLQRQHSEAQTSLDSLRAEETELVAEANELKVKVATERQRHQSLQHQRQPMAARMSELRDLIQQRRSDIDGYHTRSRQLSEDSEQTRAQIDEIRGQSAESEATVTSLIAERSEFISGIDAAENELRILRRQVSENHERRGQQEVKQTQVQLRIENLCEHILRRYQLELRELKPDTYALHCAVRDQAKRQSRSASVENEASAEPQADSTPDVHQEIGAPKVEESALDWSVIEAHVRELDQKLESMGPINIDAIEEYDELEERHTFLENQLNDLTSSKEQLLDVISKINTTTRKLFAETFEQIRVNFQEMFTELFGGGKANLVLVDESDPLESGIDIIAKPPGKQLQSVSLLSGGERTMTAVALLFSIYMVKPSPFCVLDEMDAPLDESNINRFIKILDRFVAQSQFLVITHNKRTIAKADVLYGVTMEEHGISKLVGVKFSKRDESSERSDIIGTRNPAPVPSVADAFGKSGELSSEQAAG